MKGALRYRHASIGQAKSFRKNMTDTEQKLWPRLRRNQLGHYFRRQVPVGKYIIDFMCRQKKLIIEIDGIQHLSIKGLERDRQRDEYLSSREYHVLRFNNSEISTNVDGVVDVIYGALQTPLWSPYKGDR
jgi:very-short-patch-repair endonuclease